MKRATIPNKEESIREVVFAKIDKNKDALIHSLDNPDPEVRSMAASYLARLETVEAIAPLTRLLQDSNPDVRGSAAQALGKLRALNSVPHLIPLAESAVESIPKYIDIQPKSHAITALGRIGDRRATPVLIRQLESPFWLVRRVAVDALGDLGDPVAIDALESARARESLLRRRPWTKAIRKIRRGYK